MFCTWVCVLMCVTWLIFEITYLGNISIHDLTPRHCLQWIFGYLLCISNGKQFQQFYKSLHFIIFNWKTDYSEISDECICCWSPIENVPNPNPVRKCVCHSLRVMCPPPLVTPQWNYLLDLNISSERRKAIAPGQFIWFSWIIQSLSWKILNWDEKVSSFENVTSLFFNNIFPVREVISELKVTAPLTSQSKYFHLNILQKWSRFI